MSRLLCLLTLLLALPAFGQERPSSTERPVLYRIDAETGRLTLTPEARDLIAHTERPAPSRPADVPDAPRLSPAASAAPAPEMRGSALVLTVNSVYDNPDSDPGDGICRIAINFECTLRAAIEEAVAQPSSVPVIIEFDVVTGPPGSHDTTADRWTLQVGYDDGTGSNGGLPFADHPDLTIDGTTQPGAHCGDLPAGQPNDIRLYIDGYTGNGIDSISPRLTVRGLFFRGHETAIVLGGPGSRVECSRVAYNVGAGIATYDFSGLGGDPTIIENTAVAGNTLDGVVANFDGTWIRGSTIGLIANGTNVIPNHQAGIYVTADDVLITENAVSGNLTDGVLIDGAARTVLTENRIGLPWVYAGFDVGNQRHGIALINGASDATVGAPTAMNYVAGNGQHGVYLEEDVRTRVDHNVIGLGPNDVVTPNVRDGIRLTGSTDPFVLDNTIVGNGAVGIALADDFGRTVTGAVIQGNAIGTDATGSALGNGADGIWCRNASGTLIGGGSGEGNTIAFNGTSSTFQDGVRVADEGSCTGYAIIANDIYANAGLGIDVSGGGVTPNDAPEADGFTNFPVGLSVFNDGIDAVVTVSLTGLPSATYRIDYFLSDAPDPTGYGEGQTYRLSRNFTTGGGGTDTESFAREPVHFPVGTWVTATATLIDAGSPTGYGSTSEVSQAVQVAGPPYVVTSPAVLGAYAHGSTLYVEWTTPDPALEAGPVRVSVLCPGQAPFVRYASTPNDGQAGFVVPASLGTHGGVDDQASGCTVEVASAADPSKAAESAPFTVRPAGVAGVTTRRLDLATPRNPARYGLQDVVKWFWDEASVPAGHTVRVGLVCDGRARYVRYADTANDGQAGGTLPASFGAYDVCRAEIASVDDPTLFGRSAPFAVLDTPLPSVDVLAPAPDDVIAMGQNLDITWETVSVGAGAPVRIVLVDLTNGPPNRLVAQTTNTGSYTWSVPTDLDPAAEYRLTVKVTADDGSFPKALIHPLAFTASGARTAGASASASSEDALPESLEVQSARPNPTRGRTTVRLGVPEAGPVDVAVYDAVGRRVAVLASGERAAGWHDLGVEAGTLAPGVYVVRAVAGGSVATRTLTVVR